MNKSKILRKFPYPYKCALAICSDVDATTSVERFVELQKFLCTNEQTSNGTGVALEIGNSFWFFRNSDHPGISYFEKLTKDETPFAEICREFIRSGFVDILHTYGDFNRGGFNRKYAEQAIDELVKRNLTVKTWVNHGNNLNSQNIGGIKEYLGAKPRNDSYHIDLLKAYGIKYFWTSQLTHLVGQDSRFSTTNIFKNQLQKMLAVKYGSRQIPPFFSNKLMNKILQDDGSEIDSFMRFINPWGEYSYTNAENFSNQLSEKVIAELKSNEGFMILYTHLGNFNNAKKILPAATERSLRNLAKEYNEGNIFITTTTRLLTYYEVCSLINLEEKKNDDKRIISLSFKDGFSPTTHDLSGLTFYTEDPENTIIYFNNTRLETTTNSADQTGRISVSIPWKKLVFPQTI